MKTNKYCRFQLATEFDTIDYNDYRNALREYGKANKATLYGIDEQGNFNLIFCK